MSEDLPPYGTSGKVGAEYVAAHTAVAEAREIDLQSLGIAAALIADMSGKLSSKFDTFATWLLAGFGAAVVLLLTNDKTAALVSPPAIRLCAILFGWAVVATVIEKVLALVVSSGSDTAASARMLILDHMKLRRELGQTPDLDIAVIAEEIMRPMFWPARSFASGQIRKSLNGDLTAGARPLMRYGQMQGFLVVAEVLLFLIALWQVIKGLPVG
jgi:hypothetical protein